MGSCSLVRGLSLRFFNAILVRNLEVVSYFFVFSFNVNTYEEDTEFSFFNPSISVPGFDPTTLMIIARSKGDL